MDNLFPWAASGRLAGWTKLLPFVAGIFNAIHLALYVATILLVWKWLG